MQDYSKTRLIGARTRAEVIQSCYSEDKFLAEITTRIIEDINAAIMFDEMNIEEEIQIEHNN